MQSHYSASALITMQTAVKAYFHLRGER